MKTTQTFRRLTKEQRALRDRNQREMDENAPHIPEYESKPCLPHHSHHLGAPGLTYRHQCMWCRAKDVTVGGREALESPCHYCVVCAGYSTKYKHSQYCLSKPVEPKK